MCVYCTYIPICILSCMYFGTVHMDQTILIWFQSFILSAAFSYSDSYSTIFWACEKKIAYLISLNATLLYSKNFKIDKNWKFLLNFKISHFEIAIFEKSQNLGFFLNRPPLFGQKVHFFRDFLNWPPPKNPYWTS